MVEETWEEVSDVKEAECAAASKDSAPKDSAPDEKDYSSYYTFAANVEQYWRIGTLKIKAQKHPRIKNKNGFVYAFSDTSETYPQLWEWITQEAIHYIRKNYFEISKNFTIGDVENAMNLFIERRMCKYADDFSLVRLTANDFA